MTVIPGIHEVAERIGALLDEVERAVVGKREALALVAAALLADGHVLVEDNPGTAKTLLARSFAATAGLTFARVQFTPDLLPGDVTGSTVLDPRTGAFDFRPGPVFANLVLGDEINRAPPKTQAALLEAMQERQVTVDGTSHQLPRPFCVIATQNPVEWEGTYPLPEAQLDRFLLRTSVGYPSPGDEWRVLADRAARRHDDVALTAVLAPGELARLQRAVEEVHVGEAVGRYIVALVDATRHDDQVLVGSSPRGSLALMKLARATAALAGRDFVTPDDVKALAVAALAHRLVLRTEAWARRVSPARVVEGVLDRVPTPATFGP